MSLVNPNWFERLTGKQKLIVIGGSLIAATLLISLLVWLFTGEKSKKEDTLEANIATEKGKNAVIGNLVANQQEAVNDAANTTNEAIRDLTNSANRDSSTFNGKRANSRFCARFPLDSSCQ